MELFNLKLCCHRCRKTIHIVLRRILTMGGRTVTIPDIHACACGVDDSLLDELRERGFPIPDACFSRNQPEPEKEPF